MYAGTGQTHVCNQCLVCSLITAVYPGKFRAFVHIHVRPTMHPLYLKKTCPLEDRVYE